MSPTHNRTQQPFYETRWSWQSKDSDLRVGYTGMDGRVSLATLLEHLAQVAPGVSLSDIEINYATAKWVRPATEEELADRARAQAQHAERKERWERETLSRLLTTYGVPAEAAKAEEDASG